MSEVSDQQASRVAQLLLGKTSATDQVTKTAKQLIQMAERAAPDTANWPSFAMTLLNNICILRAKSAVRISEFTVILRFILAAAHVEGSLGFAKISIEKSLADGLCKRTEDGQLEPTRQTRFVAARIKVKSNSNWDVEGLPDPLRDLAAALIKHGGRATSSVLKEEINVEPSNLMTKYPKWAPWLKKHIGRPKRGIFTMKNLVKKR